MAEQGAERQLVVFDRAGEVYGVEIESVREIIRMQEVTYVPDAPDFVEGVINLRVRSGRAPAATSWRRRIAGRGPAVAGGMGRCCSPGAAARIRYALGAGGAPRQHATGISHPVTTVLPDRGRGNPAAVASNGAAAARCADASPILIRQPSRRCGPGGAAGALARRPRGPPSPPGKRRRRG